MPGYLLYQDEERIVLVTDSPPDAANSKTAHMLQVYILVASENPAAAIYSGLEKAVCGDCKHSGPFAERTCYVNVVFAPQSIWRAWKAGKYPFLPRSRYADVFGGRRTRLGAYGDPSFIPLEILRWIVFFSDGHTGYTHQWRTCDPRYQELLMASVDSREERLLAQSMGWRTFRVMAKGESLGAHEITCPASAEAGHRTTCERCCLCDGGLAGGPVKDIGILIHGSNQNKFIQIAA